MFARVGPDATGPLERPPPQQQQPPPQPQPPRSLTLRTTKSTQRRFFENEAQPLVPDDLPTATPDADDATGTTRAQGRGGGFYPDHRTLLQQEPELTRRDFCLPPALHPLIPSLQGCSMGSARLADAPTWKMPIYVRGFDASCPSRRGLWRNGQGTPRQGSAQGRSGARSGKAALQGTAECETLASARSPRRPHCT